MRSLGLPACVFAALMCCTCGCSRLPLAHEASHDRASVPLTVTSEPRILATSLSPSGRFLALLVQSGQRRESRREDSVWCVDLRGSSAPRLALAGNLVLLHSLSWSDSPEILASVRWDVAADASQVWLLQPDLGQEPRLALTERGTRIHSATLSVRGRWLAVVREHRPSPGHVASEISLVRAEDGRALGSWITGRSPVSIRIQWSDDPPRLFFPLWDERGQSRMASVTIEPGGHTRLRPIRTRNEVTRVHSERTGQMLAYSHDTLPASSGEYAFSLLDLTTGEENTTLQIANPHHLVWSPDGRRLAFVSPTHELWLLTVATGEKKRIARDVVGFVGGAAWATGDEIFFMRRSTRTKSPAVDIWSLTPGGGGERLIFDTNAFLQLLP